MNLSYPSAPVLALIERRFIDDASAAEALGVHPRTITRWREEDTITYTLADRAATRLGYHPIVLWPDWYDRQDAHLEAQRENKRRINRKNTAAHNAARTRRRAAERAAREAANGVSADVDAHAQRAPREADVA
jgi:plasmid maintenance system antidote protein VapI